MIGLFILALCCVNILQIIYKRKTVVFRTIYAFPFIKLVTLKVVIHKVQNVTVTYYGKYIIVKHFVR